MSILTDEEMKQIHAGTFGKGLQSFARAIEAAIMSKLAEACAKVTRGEGIGFADDDEELNRIAAMLEVGERREHL